MDQKTKEMLEHDIRHHEETARECASVGAQLLIRAEDFSRRGRAQMLTAEAHRAAAESTRYHIDRSTQKDQTTNG